MRDAQSRLITVNLRYNRIPPSLMDIVRCLLPHFHVCRCSDCRRNETALLYLRLASLPTIISLCAYFLCYMMDDCAGIDVSYETLNGIFARICCSIYDDIRSRVFNAQTCRKRKEKKKRKKNKVPSVKVHFCDDTCGGSVDCRNRACAHARREFELHRGILIRDREIAITLAIDTILSVTSATRRCSLLLRIE